MPAVRGQRVVIYGDSLSSGPSSPGSHLAQRLRAAGAAEVQVDARIGRSAWNFYKREDVAAHLAATRAFQPDLAIVILGTNDIGLTMSLDAQRMRQLRTELAGAGAQVWAFGPPSFAAPAKQAGAAEVMNMMHAVFGDRLLDLRTLTADLATPGKNGRNSDGVHFTAAGGEVVGHRMAKHFLAAGANESLAGALAVLLLGVLLLR